MRGAIIAMAAALALPLLAGTARADDADGIDCAHAMAQQDMNICADKDYRKVDGALNAAYRDAMKGLEAPDRELLKAAQRAWIKFRDAECTYTSASNQGGSIYPLVYAGCLTELTRARIKQLKGGQS